MRHVAQIPLKISEIFGSLEGYLVRHVAPNAHLCATCRTGYPFALENEIRSSGKLRDADGALQRARTNGEAKAKEALDENAMIASKAR